MNQDTTTNFQVPGATSAAAPANNNTTVPELTSSEIKEWEEKFISNVSPQVQFNKQGNGYSMQAFDGASGFDANWSGIINLGGDNYIKWTFTIQGDPFVDCNMKASDENALVLTNLCKFYETWKTEWAERVKAPNAAANDSGNQSAGMAPGPDPNAAPGMNMPSGAPSVAPPAAMPVNENKRTKLNILIDNKERMMRLANLWNKK